MTKTTAPVAVQIIPVTPFQQNCSLLICTATRKAALIDPGGDIERLLAVADQHAVVIEKLLVTHGHLDHCSAVADLRDRLQVSVEGPHHDDAFWIDQIPQRCQDYGFPPARCFTPERWLAHGDEVTVGDLRLKVVHCPGHTPGHVVFVHAPSGIAFVGDVLFKGSIGRTDFPRGNHADLIDAIRGRLFPLGDHIRFVPGHGPMSSFGEERRSNPFVRG